MRHTLLLAVLVMLAPAPARAQDSTMRAPVAVADTAKGHVDSLARVDRRNRNRAGCERREALKEGAWSAFAGGVLGAALGAVPATLLSLFKFHNAARTVLWVPTVGGAVSFGLLGSITGPMICH